MRTATLADEVRTGVVRILRTHCRGRENAITRERLRTRLDLELGIRASDRTIRRVYTRIPQVGYHTGRPRPGLFWIVRQREFASLAKTEGHRAGQSYVRAAGAKDKALLHGQLGLFDAGTVR